MSEYIKAPIHRTNTSNIVGIANTRAIRLHAHSNMVSRCLFMR